MNKAEVSPVQVEDMVDLGISNSRMKDFCDVALAARRVAFVGEALVVALRATFRRRGTHFPMARLSRSVNGSFRTRALRRTEKRSRRAGPWA